MVKIKICGVTNVSDALHAAELGADAVGLNFYSGSPRFLAMNKAKEIIQELPLFVEPIIIFVNEPGKHIKSTMRELGTRTFQLHSETPAVKRESVPSDSPEQTSPEEQAVQQEKMRKGDYNLNDFRKQFAQMTQMGGMAEMMKMMPGMGDMIPDYEDPDKAMGRIAAMIDAMTDKERNDPDSITVPRRREIAAASGTEPGELLKFLKHFDQVRAMMRQMASMTMFQKLKMITGMGKAGLFQPAKTRPDRKVFPGAVKPLRLIPAFGIRDKESLRSITAYLEMCKLLGQLPAAILVDAHVPGSHGGTGQTLPWELLADFSPGVPLILAGGLTPANLAQAIRLVRPYAVDVASGVESAPGKKDAEKMKRFIDAAKQA